MTLRTALLVVAAVLLAQSCSTASLPTGERGAAADALAQRILATVDADAWAQTGAVQFTFRGKRAHLWDKARGMDRVTEGDVTTIVDYATKQGVAVRAGTVVTGAEGAALVDKAWKSFVNDTFWLNPFVKVFDPGTTRSRVVVDGQEALLVTYAAGGATPGDSYLYLMDDAGLPRALRLWVQSLPKGTEFTVGGWQPLTTGARVALRHKGFQGLGNVDLTVEAAGRSLADVLPGPDPFAALVR